MWNIKNDNRYKALLSQKIIIYNLNCKLHKIYSLHRPNYVLNIQTLYNFLFLIKKWFNKKYIPLPIREINKRLLKDYHLQGYDINSKTLIYRNINILYGGILYYSIFEEKFSYSYKPFNFENNLYGSTPLH